MKAIVDGEEQEVRAVWRDEDIIMFIDQRKLPHEFKLYEARLLDQVCIAITDMVVRGAPAIGAAAALGLAQAIQHGVDRRAAMKELKATRPTAYDLFYALDWMFGELEDGKDAWEAADEYVEIIVEKCRRIGENGEPLIKDGARILTHCNAGALATVDWGTALAPMRMAHRNGKKIFVYADETRPRLQGAMLTAWELLNEGIEHAVIADNAAGHFMARGEIDMVITGADRICANGDFANKIGTYEKAVVAKENGIPFYVAAPKSTYDGSLQSGEEIVIEERGEDEVLFARSERLAPEGSPARNPAFDCTPARYVTGFITEVGVLKPGELHRLREGKK